MSYHNLFLCLSVFSVDYLMRHVLALNAEGIANGLPGNQSDFQYLAAVFGRSDLYSEADLLCTGSIVAPSWILSLAQCFMAANDRLQYPIFTALVAFSDVKIPGGYFRDIVYIYTYNFDLSYIKNDIAMAKTKDPLILGILLNKIDVPNVNESFVNKYGVVAGYGSSRIDNEVDEGGEFFLHDSDLKLRYTHVKLLPADNCVNEFAFVGNDNKFCGVAKRTSDGRYTGVCHNDAGSPLVIDGKVVALAQTSYYDCDDTHYGSVYVDVAKYGNFINRSINNDATDSMTMHPVGRGI